MEVTENQNNNGYRSQLMNRMKSRYPDREFGGTAEGGENTANEELEKVVSEALDEYDSKIGDYESRIADYEANNNRLVDLFSTNPRAAAFLNEWVVTKSPALAFRKIYGQHAFDVIQSPEGAEIISQIEAEEQKSKTENEQFLAEKQANLEKSFDALDEWGDAKGLSDDEKVKVFEKYHTIVMDATKGIYSPELFEMGWKADHYDADLEGARHEGEVAGRNAKIKEMQRQRSNASALPPAMSGQGSTGAKTETRSALGRMLSE